MTDFIEHTSISTQTTIEKGENTLLKSRIVSPVLPLVYHGILFLHAFLVFLFQFSSVQLPSCVQLCDPMDCNTTGFPVHPGPCSNSCPLSQWRHPTISSSVVPFSHLQSFPASGSSPMSQLFASGGQSTGASASASLLPMNIQGLICFKMDWFDLLAFQETLKSLLQHNLNTSILWHSAFFMVQLSHMYMTTGKTLTLTIWTFVSKVMF